MIHMKRISVSELQNNPSKVFQELPVEIIKYGQTVAIIVAPESLGLVSQETYERMVQEAVGEDESAQGTLPKFKSSTATEAYMRATEEPENDFAAMPVIGLCHYCKTKKEVHEVRYDTPDGDELIYKICEADMSKLEKHRKEHGGTIISVDGKEYE